jgi:hypothetical protein
VDALAALIDLLRTRRTANDVIDAYLDVRSAAASFFRLLMEDELRDHIESFGRLEQEVSSETLSRFGSVIPSQYCTVSTYGDVHARLYAYLARFEGRDVPSRALRVVAGDVANTERRIRELRDLGLAIHSRHSGGERVYVLESRKPDFRHATAATAKRNVHAARHLPESHRAELLAAIDRRKTELT